MYATELSTHVQVAAQPPVTEAYGVAGAMAHGLVSNFAAALAPGVAGDPQEVADLIGGLVAQPAGQRPLYQAIGPYTEALGGLNEMHMSIQHQVLSGMGMAALLTR